MINNRTTHLDLPLPHEDNDLIDDVRRLRAALVTLDLFAGTGTAATATKLKNSRSINGVQFDGTEDITITAEAAGGEADTCSGNAGSATKLEAARLINGVEFDGTADITVEDDTKLPLEGIAASAVKLETARTINGVKFDGSANIELIAGLDHSKLPLAGGRITGEDDATNTVTGALTIAGGLGVAKNLHVGGDVNAANFPQGSDIKLKKEIETIKNALDKVRAIRGVMYTDRATGIRRTGVIAQEVQKVMPEVIFDNGDYLSVAYGSLVGLLLQAISELSDRVDDLTPRHKRK